VYVRVRDFGTGLPQPPEQVFAPFYTTKADGLGMGLAICRSIVAAHGGRLWAEANADRGATFHMSLPLHTRAA
jgi:signal transduction histidine kinase